MRKKEATRKGGLQLQLSSLSGVSVPRAHVVAEHVVSHLRAHVLAGRGVEAVVDAAILTARALVLGELPEAREGTHDIRIAIETGPLHVERQRVRAEVESQRTRGACADAGHVARVARIRR